MARIRRSKPDTSVQSWTRFRLPIQQPIPYNIENEYREDRGKWREKLHLLITAPGYQYSVCGRNVKEREEVLFVTKWDDDASVRAFVASWAYPAYLQAFKIADADTTSPNADTFFTSSSRSGSVCLSGRVTIFTLSFSYPVRAEDRDILHGARGLPVRAAFSRASMGPRLQRTWVRESRILRDGRVVENGLAVQRWPDIGDNLVPDLYTAVDTDGWARESWRQQVLGTRALDVEEATWDFPGDEDDEEEDEGEGDDDE